MEQLRRLIFAAAVLILMVLNGPTVWAASFTVTNLVSNIPGLASITDPALRNPWGMSFTSSSPIWTSNQGTNTADLFIIHGVSVTQNSLEVSIPMTAGGPQGPTGQVSNSTTSFRLGNGNPAAFIFANLNGTISAWNGAAGTAAQIQATTPGAVYTGLAMGNSNLGPTLYAANGVTGAIDVFNGTFTPSNLSMGAFNNPFPGLVPFNVQNLGGKIYVTYALPGRPAQIAAHEGQGGVAVFDQNGVLLQKLITGSRLASPWGVTFAPLGFGDFAGDLLVGNFSFVAGEINAFDPVTGAFRGQVVADPKFQGLWAITFGNGGNGGDTNILYFSTGLNQEGDGLLAAITTPEPNSFVLLLIALAGVCTLGLHSYSVRRSG